MKCSQPCIREEELNRQLSSEIQKFLCHEIGRGTMKMAKDISKLRLNPGCRVKRKKQNLCHFTKLERLLNTYLDQDIEKETYRVEKAKLILQKKSLEEEMTSSHKHNDWLEPLLIG